jgi:hypothetical protein
MNNALKEVEIFGNAPGAIILLPDGNGYIRFPVERGILFSHMLDEHIVYNRYHR